MRLWISVFCFSFLALIAYSSNESCVIHKANSLDCIKPFEAYSDKEKLDIIFTLNKQGRYKESLALFNDSNTRLTSALLLEKARAEKGLARYSQAVKTYQETLKQKPDWNMARLELAELYKKQGKAKQAQGQYNHLLDNELPPPLRQDILSSLKTLAHSRKNHYINLLLQSYYDANINKAPNQGSIHIGDYLFNFDKPIAAYILAPELRAGYNLALSPRLAWQFHGTAFLQLPLWSGEEIEQKYDKLSLKFQTGPLYQISPNQMIAAQFYGQQNYQNWQKESHSLGAQLSYYSSVFPFNFSLSHDFSVEDHIFDAFDNIHHQSYLNFIHDSKLGQINLGFQYIFHDAQKDIHSYQSPVISLVWEKDYKYNMRSTFSQFYAFRQYEDYSYLFESTRKDHEIGLFWDIAKTDWRILGLTPHIKYGYLRNYSNQVVYEQSQHSFSIYGQMEF